MSVSKHLILGLAGVAVALSAPSSAAPKKAAPKKPSPACAKLSGKYEDFSKRLSVIRADGAGDRGAVMSEASMTLDLMRSNGCKLPTDTPSDMRYLLKAMNCTVARRRAVVAIARGLPAASSIPECDWSTWTPDL